MYSSRLTSSHSAGGTGVPVTVESDSRDSYGSRGILGQHLYYKDLEKEEHNLRRSWLMRAFTTVIDYTTKLNQKRNLADDALGSNSGVFTDV